MGQMVWQKYLRGRYMHISPIKFLLLQAIKKKKKQQHCSLTGNLTVNTKLQYFL